MAEKHYFVCGNTAKGFINFFDSNLQGLSKIYILKGGPGTGKSTMMKCVAKKYDEKGFNVECIHCSSDPDSLDGVILRQIGVGIVDGTAPHVIEPKVVGAIEEYVNLGEAWDIEKLEKKTDEICSIKEQIADCYPKAYDAFARALLIHDEWEHIYITAMDFDKANTLADEVCTMLFKDVTIQPDTVKRGMIRHRFFGGSTPKGAMDYVENITQSCSKRYFIKGRPGSGKSTMLKRILRRAEELGLETEVYHCGFDSNSLDMILIPELDWCIFDSTSPHEYEPSKEGDQIIDMYEKLIIPGTDEKYEVKLNDIKSRYKEKITEGISYLKKAKELHDQLEGFYIDATDFLIIEKIRTDLIEKIEKRENRK